MRVIARRAVRLGPALLALLLSSALPVHRLEGQEPAAVKALLDSLSVHAAGASRPIWTAIRRVYAARDYAPLWLSSGIWTPHSRDWRQRLQRADEDGLDARHYLVPPLGGPETPSTARADVQLSRSVVQFVRDIGWGLTTPGAAHRSAFFVRRPFRADSVLSVAVTAPSVDAALQRLAPPSLGYTALRDALARLRSVQAAGGWTVPSAGGTLRRGDRHPRVRELRDVLMQQGDLSPSPKSGAVDSADVFEGALAGAVARFQARHGLVPDSVYGAQTRRELAVGVETRIEQVTLGMERMRWLPPTPAGRWIAVNLADYQVFVFDSSTVIFSSRVVVGAINHQTPMFIDTLTTVVLNPWWNVPPSIERNEIRPAMRRDPAYLTRNHMIRVDGGLRQLPGPWNALGNIAFMFPNAHNVYMHDTPAKALFALPDRAFSHGCIRLARPHELAQLLLSDHGWSAARIDSIIATGTRTVIPLRRGIPIRISYVTAFPGLEGQLHFRKDVYGRDAALRRAIDREHRYDSDALWPPE